MKAILFALCCIASFSILARLIAQTAPPQQPSDIVFSVGVSTKIDVTQVLRVPRCGAAETSCREFTRLCDAKGNCMLLNAGEFTLHAGTEISGGATKDVPFGTLTLTLGQP